MADRFEIDDALVAGLVAAQFPEWASLPLRRVVPGGVDNVTFRLGDAMSVRLPSAPGYVSQVEKEAAWLPRLAAGLSLPIPEVLGIGEPVDGYPAAWSVRRWLPGEQALTARVDDPVAFAVDLAAFLRELRGIDADGAPAAGSVTFHRGAPVAVYDGDVERSLAVLVDRVPVDAATALWDEASSTRWEHSPVWFHGDVAASNILVDDGRLSSVIDFGVMGVGDPACDLTIAWTHLTGTAREAFLEAVELDDATITRGRAWALWKALWMLEQSPDDVASERVIHDVLTS